MREDQELFIGKGRIEVLADILLVSMLPYMVIIPKMDGQFREIRNPSVMAIVDSSGEILLHIPAPRPLPMLGNPLAIIILSFFLSKTVPNQITGLG